MGREDDLKTLHEQLQQGQTVSISAIAGMGGIGKTELAWQYADRQGTAGTYPGGICWLRAREELGTQIVLFARSQLHLTIPDDVELAEQVARCWGLWAEQETLLVFDDVQQYQDVEAVLPPPGSHFKILLTTRSRFGHPVRNFEIEVLSESASLELLRKLVQDGRIDRELETAKQVCEWLGWLPLGLELVGRYLARKKDVSVAKLWQRLQEKRLAAQALLEAEPGMTASLGVTAAFELSWQELEQDAKQLAALLSLFALAEIPWQLVEACLPESDTEELEDLRDETLLKLSLLERTGQGLYQLHQLLREFFAVKRSHMPEDEEMKRSFCRVMVAIAKRIPQVITLECIEQFTPTLPHLKEVSLSLNPWLIEEDLIEPSTRIGWFYAGQSAFEEAEKWYLHGQAIASPRIGDEHPNVAGNLNNLAELYRAQGRHREAELLFLKSLEIVQRQLGESNLNVAVGLNNLALLYKSQKRYEEAEPLYVQSLEIMQQQLGDNHLSVATSLNNLAALYDSQERYEKAEPLYVRSLEIMQRQLGRDHPTVAASLNNLAFLYNSQGRHEEAELLYLQALQSGRQTLGEDHPNVAIWLNNLARLYMTLERYTEAETLFLQAIIIFHRRLGEAHHYTQDTCQGFAYFLHQVIEGDCTSALSDHPMTRSLLEQLQANAQDSEDDQE